MDDKSDEDVDVTPLDAKVLRWFVLGCLLGGLALTVYALWP